MRVRATVLTVGLTLTVGGPALAGLVETFPDPLGGWETRWLYVNSNLGNYYNASGGNDDPNFRGNNPEGLWMADTRGFNSGVGGPTSEIFFDDAFAATLIHLEFGMEAFVRMDVTIFDMNDNVLASGTFAGGGFDFDHADIISADSNNGIRRILFDSRPYGGGQIEGNTSVDNFFAIIPAPGALFVLGLGGALAGSRRRRRG